MPKNKVLCLRDKVKICEDSQKPGFSKDANVLIHENKKSFKCKICEKTFCKVNLHYQFMRKKEPFKCKKYDKTFYKENLY